jgi:pimeloyl-ACP methyl ester carboxylesterase
MTVVHHELVQMANTAPARWALVLHGVFGSGANWRMFMRRLCEVRPDWGFVLVDLRGHGRSPPLLPPHDLDAAAADLHDLERHVALPISGVIGHSLGGKVALAYAATRAGELDSVWSLDSQPGARDEERNSPTRAVLELLEALPPRFDDRQSFVALVEKAGQPRAIAAWLAMSLLRDGEGYRLGMDLVAIRSILEDFFRRDLWTEIERHDPRRQLHVVMAGRSYVWRDGDRQRLEQLDANRAGVHLHFLDEAGHWVHVDAPDALRDRLAQQLPR